MNVCILRSKLNKDVPLQNNDYTKEKRSTLDFLSLGKSPHSSAPSFPTATTTQEMHEGKCIMISLNSWLFYSYPFLTYDLVLKEGERQPTCFFIFFPNRTTLSPLSF